MWSKLVLKHVVRINLFIFRIYSHLLIVRWWVSTLLFVEEIPVLGGENLARKMCVHP